jgi:hypothetical protein
MNYQTLAPPITKANAAECARRATVARERNRLTRKQEILASPDLHVRKEVEKQIQKNLKWMDSRIAEKRVSCVIKSLQLLGVAIES